MLVDFITQESNSSERHASSPVIERSFGKSETTPNCCYLVGSTFMGNLRLELNSAIASPSGTISNRAVDKYSRLFAISKFNFLTNPFLSISESNFFERRKELARKAKCQFSSLNTVASDEDGDEDFISGLGFDYLWDESEPKEEETPSESVSDDEDRILDAMLSQEIEDEYSEEFGGKLEQKRDENEANSAFGISRKSLLEKVNKLRNFKYRITIAYDGTSFSGWQFQPKEMTVQESLQSVLCQLMQCTPGVLGLMGAGRTDAGVHAKGQVAHFWTTRPIENLILTHYAMNQLLPANVSVRQLAPAKKEFHALRDVSSKLYSYSIQNTPFLDPFKVYTHAHVSYKLDKEAMASAAELFLGTHDFTTFANESAIPASNKVRTISRFDLIEEEDNCFRFEVEGSGFLYKQVRNMVGLLIVIGKGRSPPDVVRKLLSVKDRTVLARLAPTAFPQGLRLEHVAYSPEALAFPDIKHRNLSNGKYTTRPTHLKVMDLTDDLKVKVEIIKAT